MSHTQLTKYEHACLVLQKGESKLVIDPGGFTKLPADLTKIVAVVVTEEHFDHFDPANLKSILSQSPNALIFTTQAVHNALAKENIKSTVVTGQQQIEAPGFKLSFYETDHAPVYQKSPCKSLATKVDDFLYYPSDSYYVINDQVEVLALPTSGPWYKLSEGIDFAKNIKSSKIIATHNALNSEDGNDVVNSFIRGNLSDNGREFVFLATGQSLN